MLAAVDRGTPRREVAEAFSVSAPTVERWLSSSGKGPAASSPREGYAPGPPPLKGAAPGKWLPGHLGADPDLLTLEGSTPRGVRGGEEGRGARVSGAATVSRAIRRLAGQRPLKKGRE